MPWRRACALTRPRAHGIETGHADVDVRLAELGLGGPGTDRAVLTAFEFEEREAHMGKGNGGGKSGGGGGSKGGGSGPSSSGGKSGGGKGSGASPSGGGGGGNWPSTTGNPSGGGRGNAPPGGSGSK